MDDHTILIIILVLQVITLLLVFMPWHRWRA